MLVITIHKFKMAAELGVSTWLLVTVVVSGVTGLFFLCFSILSLVFHFHPTLCHKKQTLGRFRGKVCSFRGGGGEALEGSITAFKNSASVDADFFISVRRTRDGEVVVFPDRTLRRCCAVDWDVEDILYRFLPRYRPPFFLHYQKGYATQGNCEKIVKLSTLFDMFPQTAIFIDVKGDNADQDLIDEIARLIVKHKRETITSWGSHIPSVHNALHNKNPFIPLWIPRRRRCFYLTMYYLGLLPFTPIHESLLITPLPSMTLDKQRGFQVGYIGGWKVWIYDRLLMNKGFIRHLKARGISTYIYCLNYPHEFARAFKNGAMGVITDFPSKLRYHVEKAKEEKREAEEEEGGL